MTQNPFAYRANQAYRGAAVSVPPLKAVALLIEGAITALQKALEAHEARRFEEGHANLMRATAILRGLSHHLDFNRGGALAERLYQTYGSLIVAALRAYGRPGARQNIGRIVKSLADLREAWKFVDATVARGARVGSGGRS
ncbi:MAG TPA: flagellar export chaperone FliS [Bradyrhizobium sp.]|nr:flagellar export chaperone FliS [Bradyrhizobium sp.]